MYYFKDTYIDLLNTFVKADTEAGLDSTSSPNSQRHERQFDVVGSDDDTSVARFQPSFAQTRRHRSDAG